MKVVLATCKLPLLMKKRYFILPVFVALSFMISFGSFATPAMSGDIEVNNEDQYIAAHSTVAKIGITQGLKLVNLPASLWDISIYSDKKDTATAEKETPRVEISIRDLDAISGPTILLENLKSGKQTSSDTRDTAPDTAQETPKPPMLEPERRRKRVDENLRPFPVIM